MGKLYIIATPIGNLEDITLRAFDTLKKVDFILCEDTRVTSKLLKRFNVGKQLISFHQHSKLSKINKIIEGLKNGKDYALATDAGTPGISDPGGLLVEEVRKRMGEDAEIIPIPGTSAVTCALSAAGVPADRFLFLGFPPHKKKRNKFFQRVKDAQETVVLYESCHRLLKTLNELQAILGKNREVVVCRELTKKFEEIKKGALSEIIEYFESKKVLGEFVIIIA